MIPTIQLGHFFRSSSLKFAFSRDHYPVMLVLVVVFFLLRNGLMVISWLTSLSEYLGLQGRNWSIGVVISKST